MTTQNPARIVLATRNLHKLAEVRDILAQLVPQLDPADIHSAAEYDLPEPVEDEVTFAGNALIKARQIVRELGVPAMADDSGLCVDVLGGAPGVFSARWCGRHGDDAANLQLLLNQLSDVPDEHRGAHFACAAALVLPDGREFVELGRMEGKLLREPVGENGFGYDPIFQAQGFTVSTAQMAPAAKNAISHRARAFEALAPLVARALG
ncbi:MAG: RdgB/HAM1 family non-canonical purine NTP pyrophosphatase [Trueperella sp.]|nr:RdgB/HAM1 family non-canonical purine NTP pyrophosphatase [Trueperella sp.]